MNKELMDTLSDVGWFGDTGAYVLVDGQYGSTGKGLMAAVLAEAGGEAIDVVMTSAGPNSGHTAYLPGTGEKIVTRQLPISAFVMASLGLPVEVVLNSGSVIDPPILLSEIGYLRSIADRNASLVKVVIHPHAAVIEDIDKYVEDSGPTARIAGTGKGVGSALARRLMREGNVARNHDQLKHSTYGPRTRRMDDRTVLIEVAQGFSLGLTSGMYPYVTSRECTVAQALADAHMPPSLLRMSVACYRTYPIRVGNTDKGVSGPFYPDQEEITWADIQVEPEITTVTGRPRRIFTWSRKQFRDSVYVNDPDVLFLNFMNYLREEEREPFIRQCCEDFHRVLDRNPLLVLLGHGPRNEDVSEWNS